MLSVGRDSGGPTLAVRPQLSLELGCDASGKTVVQSRYMAYPLSVSPLFRREADGVDPARDRRAYLYRMNTSPGLLAGDTLKMSVKLTEGSSLYLMDQAATKVHQMPGGGAASPNATVAYDIVLDDQATLEFLPEPLILFADSALRQTTQITLHPSSGLSWGEIILPGRLARGERYQFRECFSRIQLKSSDDGSIFFVDAMKLLGKENRFVRSDLFAGESILGTLILVLPAESAATENTAMLARQIESIALNRDAIELASSVLPGGRGVFVRAIASTTRDLQSCFRSAVNCVRKLRQQFPLPYSL